MNFWKNLPNDIQIQVLLRLDNYTIIYLHENNINLPVNYIKIYKEIALKDNEKFNLFLYNFIELDRLIYWIKTNNKSIINFLYKIMEQVKYKAILLFFTFLYSSEEFIDYIINNFAILNCTSVYNKKKNIQYYGIELIAIKLRNSLYTKSLLILDEICNIFFNNNLFIRNKLMNYKTNSKINISYFYWVDKAYKNILKNNKDLVFIENIKLDEE